MEETKEILVSNCCSSEMIPPDYEMAEQMGSLARAYMCYICKRCGNVCEPMEEGQSAIKTFQYQGYTINVYTNIVEWAKEFYGMPENATIANEEEVSSECMGFAQIDDKIVWIFVPREYSLRELKETVAHEIGHIIELKLPENPAQTDENDDLHEDKANHYMEFYMLVDDVVEKILIELKR